MSFVIMSEPDIKTIWDGIRSALPCKMRSGKVATLNPKS